MFPTEDLEINPEQELSRKCKHMLLCKSNLFIVPVCAKLLQSCPTLCGPTDLARHAALSLGFSRQEYWSGLPCPPPGDHPNPGIEMASLISLALAIASLPLGSQFIVPNQHYVWDSVFYGFLLTTKQDRIRIKVVTSGT